MKRQGLCQGSTNGAWNQASESSEVHSVWRRASRGPMKPAPGRRGCQGQVDNSSLETGACSLLEAFKRDKAWKRDVVEVLVLLRGQGSRTSLSASFPGVHPHRLHLPRLTDSNLFRAPELSCTWVPDNLAQSFSKSCKHIDRTYGRHLTHLRFHPCILFLIYQFILIGG